MVQETSKQFSLKNLLSNALPILCKNALKLPDVDFCIEALVGVTVGGGDDVILVSIKESISSNGTNVSYAWNVKKDISSGNAQPDVSTSLNVCDLTNDDDEEEDDAAADENYEANHNNNQIAIVKQEITYGNNMNNNNNINNEHFQTNNKNNDNNNNNNNNSTRCNFIRNNRNNNHFNKNNNILYPQTYNNDITGDSNNNDDHTANFIKNEIIDENEYDNQNDSNVRQHQQQHYSNYNTRKSFSPNFRLPRVRGGPIRRFARGRVRKPMCTTNSINLNAYQQFKSNITEHRQQHPQQQNNSSYNEILNEMCQQVVDQSMSAEMQYVCHICQARRCSKSSLRNHIRGTHLAMDKYDCKICGEKFRWFMQLHRHRKKFHPYQDVGGESGGGDGGGGGGYMEAGGDEDCGGGGGNEDGGGGGDGGGYDDDGVGYLDPSVVGGLLESFGGGGGAGVGSISGSGGNY